MCVRLPPSCESEIRVFSMRLCVLRVCVGACMSGVRAHLSPCVCGLSLKPFFILFEARCSR